MRAGHEDRTNIQLGVLQNQHGRNKRLTVHSPEMPVEQPATRNSRNKRVYKNGIQFFCSRMPGEIKVRGEGFEVYSQEEHTSGRIDG